MLAVVVVCVSAAPALAQEVGRVSAIGGITFQTRRMHCSEVSSDSICIQTPRCTAASIYAQRAAAEHPARSRCDQRRADGNDRKCVGIKGDIRAFTGVGGVGYRVPMQTTVRPYLLAGGGLARINMRIRERDLGVMPQEILDRIGLTRRLTRNRSWSLAAASRFRSVPSCSTQAISSAASSAIRT